MELPVPSKSTTGDTQTLWMVPCKREHTALATSVYAKQPCNNLQWSITRSFSSDVYGAWSFTSQTPRVRSVSRMKLAPEWGLISVNFDPVQKIGPKVGSDILLNSCFNFCTLSKVHTINSGYYVHLAIRNIFSGAPLHPTFQSRRA